MKNLWQIAGFTFDPNLHQLEGPDSSLRLEPRTAAVLLHLAQHAGEVLSREQLLEAVWQDAFVGESILTHCIWELRKAFGDNARAPNVIQTVPRRGYRLIGSVSHSGSAQVKTLLLLAGFESSVAELLESSGGSEVAFEHATLAVFDRPIEAVRCAVALHRQSAGASQTRAAIHMDEVLMPSSSQPGLARLEDAVVKPAETLLDLAVAGQILLTRAAFDTARRASSRGSQDSNDGSDGLCWEAHGPYASLGEDESIEVFEVGYRGRGQLAAPVGSAGVRRVPAAGMILGWRPGPGLPVPQRPHWRLVEKLGEGSFGEVWLSEHEKTHERRVFKFCFEVERLRALQREVTLFRLLKETLGDRDDIVHLLDWNFDQAPYFIEMEHTSAGSLMDWSKDRDLENLPMEQRLELVAQTADALAAAHSVGVLHKDVKPSNILIRLDPRHGPRVRLGDFGIGTVLDRHRLADAGITQLGLTRLGTEGSSGEGTRLYMSPEVLEGRTPSTEADVYSLGVVLFQMVVGDLRRAVAEGWQRGVADEVLRQDIASCLDLSPERRPSARQLADRLRSLQQRQEDRRRRQHEQEQALRDRHLADERLRLLQESQRRRRGWWLAAVVSIALTMVVSLLAWQARSARQAAERSRAQAEDLVTYLLGDLRRTLGSVGRLDAMDGTMDKVLSYLDATERDGFEDDNQGRRAEALRQLGAVRMEQGKLDQAREIFQQAVDLASSLVRRDPSRGDWRAGEADSRYYLGLVHDRQGDLEEALAAYEYHRSQYQRLVAEQPDNRGWLLELAYGYQNVGMIVRKLGDLDRALQSFTRSGEIYQQLSAADPADVSLQLLVAGAHNRLGAIEHRRGRLEPALKQYRADQEVLHRLLQLEPENIQIKKRLATAGSFVSSLQLMRGRPAAALEEARKVLTLRRELMILDPENREWQRFAGVARRRVGQALLAQGLADEALAELELAADRLEGLDAGRRLRKEKATILCLSAQGRLRLERREPARRDIEEALAILEQAAAELPSDLGIARRLSQCYLLMGDLVAEGQPRAADGFWRTAAANLAAKADGSSNPELLDPLAQAFLRLGELERAEPLINRLEQMGYRSTFFVEACRRAGVRFED